MKKRGASYSRVSSIIQEDNNSLPTQLEGSRVYAAAHDIELIEELHDIESGAEYNRPGLNQLRELVRRREIDAVVFYCVDRVARDVALYYILKDELRKANVELHYVTKGQIVDGVEGILSDGLDILLAQIERYRIRERFERGRKGKLLGTGGKESRIYGHGNNPPYGYRYEGHKAERHLVIVEAEARIAVLIFEWYVVERLSTGRIADRLTDMHIPTPSDGGRNIAQRVRGPCEWSKTTVARILHGYPYIGIMYHDKHKRKRNSTKVEERPMEEWIGVSVPAIIDLPLWQAAQKLLAEGAPMSRRNCKNFYLLGRRVRCQCGKAMYGKDDHGTLVYHCGGRDKSAARKCTVQQKDIDAPVIEPIVWNWLSNQLQPDVLKEGILQMRGESTDQRKRTEEQIAVLTQRRNEIDKERRKAVAAYQADAITLDELKQNKEMTDEALRSIDAEMARLRERLTDAGPNDEEIVGLLTLTQQLHEEMAYLTPERRREVIDLVDLRVIVELDEDESRWANVTCRLAADRLLLQKVASANRTVREPR